MIGADGRSLRQAWEQGARTHRTIAVPGLPNLFFLAGPNRPLGNISVIDISETQAGYILGCIEKLRRDGGEAIEPTPEAMRGFNRALSDAMKGTVWVTGCKGWYLDGDGVPILWPGAARRFHRELARPDFSEFRIHPTTKESGPCSTDGGSSQASSSCSSSWWASTATDTR